MKWFGAFLVAGLVGCSALITGPDAPGTDLSTTLPTDPNRVRVMGAIAGFNNDDPQITIVPQNANVLVKVITYGDGCLSKGETVVTVEGSVATITPYDYTASAGVCTQQLVSFSHTATVDFRGAKGAATIRVQGLDQSRASLDNQRGVPVTVERTITLR